MGKDNDAGATVDLRFARAHVHAVADESWQLYCNQAKPHRTLSNTGEDAWRVKQRVILLADIVHEHVGGNNRPTNPVGSRNDGCGWPSYGAPNKPFAAS